MWRSRRVAAPSRLFPFLDAPQCPPGTSAEWQCPHGTGRPSALRTQEERWGGSVAWRTPCCYRHPATQAGYSFGASLCQAAALSFPRRARRACEARTAAAARRGAARLQGNRRQVTPRERCRVVRGAGGNGGGGLRRLLSRLRRLRASARPVVPASRPLTPICRGGRVRAQRARRHRAPKLGVHRGAPAGRAHLTRVAAR